MKTKLIIFIAFLATLTTVAQQGINYKALIKDDSGNVMSNQPLTIQFTIRRVDDGSIACQEDHNTTTDANGIVIVNIGEGNLLDGNYETIDWGSSEHVLNVQIDSGSGLVDLGTTQFMAVPYALSAANVSGLEAIDEGNGIGWRLIGRNPDHYGNIGLNAIDLSYSNSSSTTRGATGFGAFAIGIGVESQGNYSFSQGGSSKALGLYAVATGFSTQAIGAQSTAMGTFSIASGTHSTAMGQNTTASAVSSTAMGFESVASGDYSTALGAFTEANKIYSTAMGRQTLASGDNATAMGYLSTASGLRSTAMGYNTVASGENATAFGHLSNASGYNSIAGGTQSVASASYSTAIGNNAEANYMYAVAIGNSVLSSRRASVAMGTNTTASGDEAFAMGNNNVADGGQSVALGFLTNATNDYSFAMGNSVNVSGFSSGAIGYFLNNDEQNSFAVGKFNDNTTDSGALFMVGNGGGDTSRSNAFMVYQNGNAFLSGNLSQSSDRRLKQDINDLDYGLNEIMKLKPVSYHWKKHPDQPKSLGLIAQEIQPIIKEIVHTAEDEDQTLSVSYTELIPVLIKAIQEQQVIIESQKLTINNQEQASTEQSALLQALLDRVEALEKRSVTSDFKLVKN